MGFSPGISPALKRNGSGVNVTDDRLSRIVTHLRERN
jgi:hypothetical protein